MANQEHLDILKQGIDVWNRWRRDQQQLESDPLEAFILHTRSSGADLLMEVFVSPLVPRKVEIFRADLIEADLSRADLSHANFRGVNLSQANLYGANLERTDFMGAELNHAYLPTAHLRGASFIATGLTEADFTRADLREAIFYKANLSWADLIHATLYKTDFSKSSLHYTNFSKADLSETNFAFAMIADTTFGDVDLSNAKGLETVEHFSSSTIGLDTVIRSQGKIPEIFLRQAGVPESIIEQIHALIGSLKPIDYYSCFISYSGRDEDFAKRLYADLQAAGVRCWFAPEDMKIGDRLRPRIDESIRIHDKLLLVLSEHSVTSKWVEFEVEAAMDKEEDVNHEIKWRENLIII